MIYLDYNATAPYSPSVKKFITEEMLNLWANPSSEYIFAAQLSDDIKLIRSSIAEKLGCSSKSIIFNSGATESINTVLSEDNLNAHAVKRIISSQLEHHATLDRLKYLRSRGWDVLYLENNRDGVLNLEQLKTILKDDTKSLVSLLYANNETGVIHPIKEISDLVHQSGHLLHIDAVQALGKIKFSIEDLDLDFASFSGHKIGAFKGIGCLYVKDIKKHMALLHGGGQERGFRPGTLNYPAIKSFSLALDDYMRTDLNELLQVRKALEIDLKNLGFKINCEDSNRLPNTISIMIPGMSAKEILAKLAREEIFVSTGSACSSGSFEPSHVLKGLGFTREEANSCLRISIGPEKFQIKIFLNNLREIVSI